jgi:hypothetical protein
MKDLTTKWRKRQNECLVSLESRLEHAWLNCVSEIYEVRLVVMSSVATCERPSVVILALLQNAGLETLVGALVLSLLHGMLFFDWIGWNVVAQNCRALDRVVELEEVDEPILCKAEESRPFCRHFLLLSGNQEQKNLQQDFYKLL